MKEISVIFALFFFPPEGVPFAPSVLGMYSTDETCEQARDLIIARSHYKEHRFVCVPREQ